MIEMKIKGGKELQDALRLVTAKLEGNITRAGLRKAANVILAEAKANVPVDQGALRDSLRVSTRNRKGRVSAMIKTNLFYARFVEFGTAGHDIKPKGAKSLFLAGMLRELAHHPGAKAMPFMRPAMDAKIGAAIQAYGDHVRSRLTKQGIQTDEFTMEDEE